MADVLQRVEALSRAEQVQLLSLLTQQLNSETTSASTQLAPQTDDQTEEDACHNASIWQLAAEFVSELTPEDLVQLPEDGAQEHDHYLYGSPKIST